MPLPRIKPTSLADYLDARNRPVFQGGISWSVVDTKWPNIREAFHDLDPEWVARLTPCDIDRLAADRRVIRNRPQIEGTVANARTMLERDSCHRGLRRYLRSFADDDALSADLQRTFRFLGDHGVYNVLWTVSEDVPADDDWAVSRGLAPGPGT